MGHALDIPEIAFHLGPFLNPRSLIESILVSRQWHQNFLPSLWTNIGFNEALQTPQPSVECIQRYQGLVRQLSLGSLSVATQLTLFQATFPRLTSLTIRLPVQATSMTEDPVEDFIRRHRLSLRELTLQLPSLEAMNESNAEHGLESPSFWNLVLATGDKNDCQLGESYPLKSLTLDNVILEWAKMDKISGLWDVLRNLESRNARPLVTYDLSVDPSTGFHSNDWNYHSTIESDQREVG